MFISDRDADDLVARNASLQDIVHGRSLALWIPGNGTAVAVTMCLTFGWAGTGIVMLAMLWPHHPPEWFLFATAIVAAFISVCSFRVLRGYATARARIYQLSMVLLVWAVLVFAMALTWSTTLDRVASGLGLIAALTANRLVSSAYYATFSAFCRSKHAFAELVQAELRRTNTVAAPGRRD